LSVTISPSEADSTLTASQVAATAGPKSSNKSADALRADHPEGPARAASLIPLYLQPQFFAAPSLLVVGFSVAWAAARRRRRSDQTVTVYARSPSKTAKRVLTQLEAAARAKNAALFFELARGALLQFYAADVDARLANDEELQQLFDYADESKYSGHELQATHFARWLAVVRERLTEEFAA
jgi:hypothetical protein